LIQTEVVVMNRKLVAIVAAALAVFCLEGLVAEAATPVSGSGTFVITLTPVGTRTADGNTFIDFTFDETIRGLYSGRRVGQGSLVVHPDGTVTARDSGVFTGTVAGRSGTAILSVEGVGTFAALTAQVQASDGTGGLTDIHSQAFVTGSAVGLTTLAGTYTGRVQFGAQ
jgi:hypothetical protein